MSWNQYKFSLSSYSRGYHIITSKIEEECTELSNYEIGLAHLFLCHTSASLTINENADPSVRIDFKNHIDKLVPENQPYYTHTFEGSDDMPAHLKSSLLGNDLTIPVRDGKLAMGTWQGIYLCEHRNYASSRTLIVTLNGNKYK